MRQGFSTILSQLPAKVKGSRPLSALSALGESKAPWNAKSQASGEVKALFSAKSSAYKAKAPAISTSVLGGTEIASGKASALNGTKFTSFKAKLALWEAISIKAEVSKTKVVCKTSALGGTNMASGEANIFGGTKPEAFYKTKAESGD